MNLEGLILALNPNSHFQILEKFEFNSCIYLARLLETFQDDFLIKVRPSSVYKNEHVVYEVLCTHKEFKGCIPEYIGHVRRSINCNNNLVKDLDFLILKKWDGLSLRNLNKKYFLGDPVSLIIHREIYKKVFLILDSMHKINITHNDIHDKQILIKVNSQTFLNTLEMDQDLKIKNVCQSKEDFLSLKDKRIKLWEKAFKKIRICLLDFESNSGTQMFNNTQRQRQEFFQVQEHITQKTLDLVKELNLRYKSKIIKPSIFWEFIDQVLDSKIPNGGIILKDYENFELLFTGLFNMYVNEILNKQ